MDALALEAKGAKSEGAAATASAHPKNRPKPPQKAKRIVYFELEILDVKTREKLLLLDKV